MTHNLSEGGLVRLDLKFYPANPLKFPVSTLNTRRQLLGASESLLDSALRRYRSVMATVDAVRINIQALRSALSGVFATIQRQFVPFMAIYSDVTALVHSLVNAPLTVSTLFTTFFASFDGDSQRARRASGTSSSGSSVTGSSASASASGNSGGTSNRIASRSSGNGGASSVETVDYRSVISRPHNRQRRCPVSIWSARAAVVIPV